MNPYLILGALSAVLTAYFYGHHAGFAERDQEMQAEIATKNAEARDREAELRDKLYVNDIKLKEANDAISKKQSSLNSLIAAGRVRISSPGCVQANASAATPAGSGDQAPSESERATLAAIAAIVAQGDRNTEQLNACIDAYNQVREAANGQR